MRSLPAILLALLTAVVIGVSALATMAHFGVRDWPTPPMPDTATRLITRTEATDHKVKDQPAGGDPIDVEVVVDTGAGTSHRGQRRGHQRRAGKARRTRGGASRRSDPGRSEHHSGGRRSDDPASAPGEDGAATPDPSET